MIAKAAGRAQLATRDDFCQLRGDMEWQTRLLIVWFVAAQIALSVLLYTALTGALG